MTDPITKASDAAGGMTKLAAAIGATVQTVSNWKTRGVPVDQCAAVELASGGKVKRWDLRPADWHRIWPELVGAEGAPTVPAQEAA